MFVSLWREHLPLHLFILVFRLFTLQIGRLSGYANSILELFKSQIYFVNCVLGFAQWKFFLCILWIIFHIAKHVFNLVCLHFVFIPQCYVCVCNFAWFVWCVCVCICGVGWGWGFCLEPFPFVLWLLVLFICYLLSIYLFIFI